MIVLKRIFVAFFLLIGLCSFAQGTLKAKVSKNRLGVHQRFKIEFTVDVQGADNFKAPNFKNFKVIAGPSQSVSQMYINGRSSFSKSYIYILEPKRVGVFNLPSASIEYNNKQLKSQSIEVKVLSEKEIPRDPNDPVQQAKDKSRIIAEISNRNPYVGERITVTFKYQVSGSLNAYSPSLSELPKFNGFWSEQIEVKQREWDKVTVDNAEYRSLTLQKLVLIPQKSGKLRIEPIALDAVLGIPVGVDFFGNIRDKKVELTINSGIQNIQVKALPLEGQPENFSGAVGDFSYKASTKGGLLTANESASVIVEVSGQGNLKMFELPKIIAPDGLEVFNPKRNEKVKVNANGMLGRITETYSIVPEFKGKYVIPPTSFSYFNPKEKKYHTIDSPPLVIQVTEGKDAPKEAVEVTKDTKTNTTLSNSSTSNFKYIITETDFTKVTKEDFIHSFLYYSLLLFSFLMIPIGILIEKRNRKKRGDIIGNKIRKADRLAKKFLGEATKKIGDKEPFYIAIEKALHNFLKAKLRVETSDISTDKITKLLDEKGVEESTNVDFIALLKEADFARYTPASNLEMKEVLERAKQVLVTLDKQL